MANKHFFRIGIIGIALLCFFVGVGAAASDNASLQVRATVLPWVKAQAIQQTASYQVTRADIAKGYTDLTAAVSLQIQTNIVHGKLLLQVANLGAEQVLVKQAGTFNEQIFIPLVAGNPQEIQTYDLRVVLPPAVVIGSYPLYLSMQTTVL
ncbi:MAG: hypothetical protein IBX46_08915 [Desulfuromonadales bacterium]|nr:hypothetical protein [Desulfuromonadales bacterium]